jgi:hypothetical protein
MTNWQHAVVVAISISVLILGATAYGQLVNNLVLQL